MHLHAPAEDLYWVPPPLNKSFHPVLLLIILHKTPFLYRTCKYPSTCICPSFSYRLQLQHVFFHLQLMPSHPPAGLILLVWVYLKKPIPKHTSWAIHHVITSLTTSHLCSSHDSDQLDLNFPSAVELML